MRTNTRLVEGVQAAAGEEGFARVGRVLALHRGRQHRGQAAVGALRQRAEILERPLRHAVFRIDFHAHQADLVHRRETLVQLVDDVEIGHQGAQLGGRAEVELGAFVDVERLVVVVGLDPQVVHVLAALHQGEAVHHLGRVAVAEQALAGQAGFFRMLGVGQLAQHVGDGLLDRGVEGRHHRQVEAVKVVQARVAHQVAEVVAHRVGGLARHESVGARRGHARALGRVQLRFQGRVAQLRRDHAGLGQHAQVAVGQRFQILLAGAQVVGRAALRDHQGQRFLVGGDGVRAVHRAAQHAAQLVEIAPVPDPHAVADAIDLAVARLGRQRHGIQVVEHDLAPRPGGVLAVLVGAQRGRGHLDHLVLQRTGAPFRRMAVFLDLGRQGAAAGDAAFAAQADAAQGLVEHRLREAVPFDRRIAVRVGRVEQLAVLDEQQALHQQRRRVVELVIEALGEARREQRLRAAVEDLEADLGLLVVGGIQAAVGHLHHLGRDAGLGVDMVAARLQLLQVVGQVGIAEAGIVGARGREADRGARPLLHAEAQIVGHVGEDLRLQARAAHLERTPAAQQHQQDQEGEVEVGLEAALARRRFGSTLRPAVRRLGRRHGGARRRAATGGRQVRIGFVQGNVVTARGREHGGAASHGLDDAPEPFANCLHKLTWPLDAANTFHDGSIGSIQYLLNPRDLPAILASGLFE
jgi:hypothetical protein